MKHVRDMASDGGCAAAALGGKKRDHFATVLVSGSRIDGRGQTAKCDVETFIPRRMHKLIGASADGPQDGL